MTTAEEQQKLDSEKLALERYRNVIGYLQYENGIFWTRVGFIIAAQAGLIAFDVQLLFSVLQKPNSLAFWFVGGICVLGLAICFIGLRTTSGSKRWIYRWRDILLKLEPDAYGEIEVFRGTENSAPGLPRHSTREAANHLLYVFVASWLVLLVVLALSIIIPQLCGQSAVVKVLGPRVGSAQCCPAPAGS
jgi:hypothetical protein